MEWVYTGLGGIYQASNSVAYSDIIIAPKPVGNISWVKCSYNSTKGSISSEWEIEANTFTLNIEIPKDASAEIVIPEEYMGSSCKIMDLTKQNYVDVEIIEKRGL